MRRVLRDIPQADESMAAEASAPQPEASAASAPSGGIGFYPLLSMALIVSIALPWIAWMLLREPELRGELPVLEVPRHTREGVKNTRI